MNTPPTPTNPPNLALYIHWPFCVSKCPYCDFNSHAAGAISHAEWRDALVRELGYFAPETEGRVLTSIFFGGGTPSLMEAATVEGLINAASGHWRMADDIEITLEANPSSVEAAKFADFAAAGVNRVSLGVQSFDNAALKFLGRAHDAREAETAIELAATHFPRFSFDLIYARDGQSQREWDSELDRALSFGPHHLSLYQLTIEPGTEFKKNRVPVPDDDAAADLYEHTQARMNDAGLPAYEVSNHARVGDESRHNLTYWQGGDYLGIGPGAHGRITSGGVTSAQHRLRDPDKWLNAVTATGHGTAKQTPLSPEERQHEVLLMGLRLSSGIKETEFNRLCGCPLNDAIDPDGLAKLLDANLIERDAVGIRTTPAGRLCLNTVIEMLAI